MKRLAAVALVVFCIALPACAQRTSAHGGGFSSHSAPAFHTAPAFHGSFSAPAPSRSAGFRGYPANRPYTAARGIQRIGNNFGARPPYTGDLRHRRPYRSPYGILGYGGYGYPGYGYPGFIGPGYLGDSGDSGYDDSQQPQDDANAQQDYSNDGPDQGPGQAPDQQQQLPSWPYGSAQPAPAYAQPAPPAPSQEAVTLIFKDGRPPMQIHNFLITRDTLYVGDQLRREIPVDQLDLAATEKANRDAGVDFNLPTHPGS